MVQIQMKRKLNWQWSDCMLSCKTFCSDSIFCKYFEQHDAVSSYVTAFLFLCIIGNNSVLWAAAGAPSRARNGDLLEGFIYLSVRGRIQTDDHTEYVHELGLSGDTFQDFITFCFSWLHMGWRCFRVWCLFYVYLD